MACNMICLISEYEFDKRNSSYFAVLSLISITLHCRNPQRLQGWQNFPWQTSDAPATDVAASSILRCGFCSPVCTVRLLSVSHTQLDTLTASLLQTFTSQQICTGFPSSCPCMLVSTERKISRSVDAACSHPPVRDKNSFSACCRVYMYSFI